jgi:hypothetical protein
MSRGARRSGFVLKRPAWGRKPYGARQASGKDLPQGAHPRCSGSRLMMTVEYI